MLAFLTAITASAQEIRVSGTVTDSSTGEPVPYASVHVEGTMTGTNTDGEGQYSLEVPRDGILVFSSIGYTTIRIPVESRTLIDISLSPDTEYLDETIVVAYGTATKSSFTGSASMVRAEAIESRD